MIRDKKAEELEAKGLFRRAAARWLDVMAACTEDADRSRRSGTVKDALKA